MLIFGGLRSMWVILMFDLPVKTKTDRRKYTVFRKNLLRDGFTQMQYSIYIRHCASEENTQVHFERVKGILPDKGEVRLLNITDKQFGRMKVFYGKLAKKPEKAPAQLEFF